MEACRHSQGALQPSPAGSGGEGPQNFYGSGPTDRKQHSSSSAGPHLSHHLLPLPSQGPKVYLLGGWTGQQLEAWQAFGLGACSSPEQPGQPNSDPGACVLTCCPSAKYTFFAINKSKPSIYGTVRNTGKLSHQCRPGRTSHSLPDVELKVKVT